MSVFFCSNRFLILPIFAESLRIPVLFGISHIFIVKIYMGTHTTYNNRIDKYYTFDSEVLDSLTIPTHILNGDVLVPSGTRQNCDYAIGIRTYWVSGLALFVLVSIAYVLILYMSPDIWDIRHR